MHLQGLPHWIAKAITYGLIGIPIAYIGFLLGAFWVENLGGWVVGFFSGLLYVFLVADPREIPRVRLAMLPFSLGAVAGFVITVIAAE